MPISHIMSSKTRRIASDESTPGGLTAWPSAAPTWPYPADDPDLTKLRENLAKYNPGEETVDKIVSALTP